MNNKHNPELTGKSQELRRNMTKEERHLWYDFLRLQPQTINRQKVLGRYIADFYCAEFALVIELDGDQHYKDKGREYDARRDEYLRGLGLTVLRFSNYELHTNFYGVCSTIHSILNPNDPMKRGE